MSMQLSTTTQIMSRMISLNLQPSKGHPQEKVSEFFQRIIISRFHDEKDPFVTVRWGDKARSLMPCENILFHPVQILLPSGQTVLIPAKDGKTLEVQEIDCKERPKVSFIAAEFLRAIIPLEELQENPKGTFTLHHFDFSKFTFACVKKNAEGKLELHIEHEKEADKFVDTRGEFSFGDFQDFQRGAVQGGTAELAPHYNIQVAFKDRSVDSFADWFKTSHAYKLEQISFSEGDKTVILSAS